MAIEIKRPSVEIIEFSVRGMTPLIVHKWSEKAKKEMRDKQQKKAAKAKSAKDCNQEYQDSMYRLEDGGHGFPVVAFKLAAVRAGKMLGLTMTDLRQMFHVLADEVDLVRIEGTPQMREDPVKLPGSADLRYRAEYPDWSATLQVKYVADFITEEQIVNLFETAGMTVGVGEWRPEKNGQFGQFTLLDS